ncbi:urokinase plasminogen activator surface receptor-like [Heteronotia binoei]|uniref:urokinase plasminogen activator surface receptor-like n=1 Tax=Heteronotia binoei TaxID=13085 RepID=UPI00292D27C5|nr:urokinase plasminogen activator surface receptor-like [Heteronotia binoei]
MEREKCQQGTKAVLGVAVFFSILVTAGSLRCYQCVGMFQECIETEQQCTNKDRSCFSSTIQLFDLNKNDSGVFMLPDLELAEYVMKGCSGEGVANRTSNVHSDEEREVHKTYYCDSDLCNTHFTDSPASSPPVANGMECYSCYDRGTGECAQENATRVTCVGDMDQCMDFSVIDGAQKATYRTCALETLCRRQYVVPELSGRVEISCCSSPLCNDGRPGLKSICSHFSKQGIKRQNWNGLECASCCETGRGECASGNWTSIKCVGNQHMCVNVTENGQTLLRGCSLKKLCWEKPHLLGLSRNASIQCCSGILCNGSEGPVGGAALIHVLLLSALLMARLL